MFLNINVLNLLLMLFSSVLCLPTNINYMNEHRRQNLLNIINKFHPDESVSCKACRGIVGIIQSFAASGHGEEYFYDFAKFICDKFKIEDKTVCADVCNEFKDTVWNVFIVDTILTPDDICNWVFGSSCGNPVEFFPSWNISIPEKMSKTISKDFPQNIVETVKVIQITDIHLDKDYMEGSKVDCGRPLCCRKEDGQAGVNETSAPKWGYAGYCDSNVLMVNSMFEHMATVHKDVDYIIWTGDVPPHNVWDQSRDDQKESIQNAAALFAKYFPGKKVFPSLGNHEGSPVDNFPPPSVKGKMGGQWLLDTLADVWSKWLPEDTKETIKLGGYYTTLIDKGVRLISLNTNFGNDMNFWLYLDSVDPAEELHWLVNVLQKAEDNNEKVHIIGHMPPNSLLKWWSYNYYRIINRYHEIIKAQFFGHTHHDEFIIFYDMKTYTVPINIAYIAPSVTTYNDLNPGYRVYHIDGTNSNSSWHVVDHQTYFFDLSVTHLDASEVADIPLWQLEYSALSMYPMKDLSVSSWNELIFKMEKDDNLFNKFYRAFYKQHIKDTCTGLCKQNFLCVLKTGLSGSFHNFCDFAEEDHFKGLRAWIKETYSKC
ncbi:sphingomyelin phosphodiesterase isoform X1 [Hydra vulgaris]|nr:sphingomyelin phosphodiesterase [Hydra vulgaris]